jgi:hypothetical protein
LFKRFAVSSGFVAVTVPSSRFQVILLGTLDELETDLNNDHAKPFLI